MELFVSNDNSVMISKSESSIVEVDGQRIAHRSVAYLQAENLVSPVRADLTKEANQAHSITKGKEDQKQKQ